MCFLSSNRAIFNSRAIFVSIMSFGLAPAALTQSAHNTPISKYYTKYSLYDAPRARGGGFLQHDSLRLTCWTYAAVGKVPYSCGHEYW